VNGQASVNYDDLSLDELKDVLTNLMSRLELARAALAKKLDTPKMVAAKVEGTFPDLPWGGAHLSLMQTRSGLLAITVTETRRAERIPVISASRTCGTAERKPFLCNRRRGASAKPSFAASVYRRPC
jgi:hypothetical protein